MEAAMSKSHAHAEASRIYDNISQSRGRHISAVRDERTEPKVKSPSERAEPLKFLQLKPGG